MTNSWNRNERNKAMNKLIEPIGYVIWTGVVVGLIFIAFTVFTGCSSESAKANGGCTANEFNAPSGARCFVIYCDGNPVAGNCN